VPFRRRNLSQSDFSVKAVREGNTIPATIRELDAYESGKEMVNLGLSSVNILYTCWLSCYCFVFVFIFIDSFLSIDGFMDCVMYLIKFSACILTIYLFLGWLVTLSI